MSGYDNNDNRHITESNNISDIFTKLNVYYNIIYKIQIINSYIYIYIYIYITVSTIVKL